MSEIVAIEARGSRQPRRSEGGTKPRASNATPGWEMRATQKDVARLAGVSQSTVSAIMRNDKTYVHFSEAAREAVLAATQKLNYRPNTIARSMRRQRFHNIGLVISHPENVPYVPGLIYTGILQETARRGYLLSLVHDPFDVSPSAIGQSFHVVESQVDAFMVYNSGFLSQELFKTLEARRLPYLTLNHSRAGNCVQLDDVGASEAATTHLLAQGYRHPIYVAITSNKEPGPAPASPRHEGCRRVLAQHGIPEESLGASREDLPRVLADFLRTRPTVDSMVCSNDLVACVAQQALALLGKFAGPAFGVIGFNGETFAQLSPVPLSTMVIPWKAMAIEAVSTICCLIDDPQQIIPPKTFKATLFAADSTRRF